MFYKKSAGDGLHGECKTCLSARSSRNRRKRNHGLTDDQLEKILEPAVCECCGSSKRVAIDHDHKTGKVRGLLCLYCNTALGKLDDDVPRMLSLCEWVLRSGFRDLSFNCPENSEGNTNKADGQKRVDNRVISQNG
jgi:hypothetical protein